MKHLLLPVAILASTLAPVLAITDAEIAPANLVGKTLVFTIVNGGAPYATTGTWSGSFAASGNAFTAKKVTGDFVDITTTFSAAADGLYTNISLAKLVEGQEPAQITLYTDKGVGKYEAYIDGVFGVSLNGTFVFGTATPKGAEISIQQPAGTELTDNKGKKSFGTAQVSKSGVAKTFTIKNGGASKLKKIAVASSGKNAADFIVTPVKKATLASEAVTTFKVTFKPKANGTRNAVIKVTSSDKDESPFEIKVTGLGVSAK
ncbi:MAG: choice-of-anchor D domain-containing protein [Verrucomicrobiaceae bacterium]|nr:MAG: choice-of-anchor D domain-containing protein [Verrucomicrobiaceae bacterium]